MTKIDVTGKLTAALIKSIGGYCLPVYPTPIQLEAIRQRLEDGKSWTLNGVHGKYIPDIFESLESVGLKIVEVDNVR